VLYELLGVPGIWHEQCLTAATEAVTADTGPEGAA